MSDKRMSEAFALDRYKNPNRFLARDAGIGDIGRERAYGPYQPLGEVSDLAALAENSANLRYKTGMIDYPKHLRFSDMMESRPESSNIEYGEPAPWRGWLKDKARAMGF